MKNLLLLSAFALMVFSTAGRAMDSHHHAPLAQHSKNEGLNDLIRLIGNSGTLRFVALHGLIDMRCQRYLTGADAKTCTDTTRKMLRILDFDLRFLDEHRHKMPAFVFVAFETSLIELLNQESTARYLEQIAQKFEAQTYNSLQLFNLWDETLAFYQGNQLQALAALAVLFQDNSSAQIHLEYLARRQVEGSRFFDPNVARLSRVIDQMIRMQEERPELFNAIAYPASSAGSLNNSIYHYYVPWYLAAQLQANGVSARAAAMAPLMLSTTYEFITSSPDYSHLLFDPKTIQQNWTIRDIYAGYLGAHQAVNRAAAPLTLERVKELFQQNTTTAMQELLKSL